MSPASTASSSMLPGSTGPAAPHPALGCLVFLVEPGGVRLRWLVAGDGDWTGLKPANVADDPSARRGPETLPLRPNAWNAVKLALDGRAVTLDLNGVRVFER